MNVGIYLSTLPVLIVLVFIRDTSTVQLEKCDKPLGMETGSIPDEDISSSSTHNAKSVGPQNARIRQELEGGAWCPLNQVTEDAKEYIELNLGELNVITAVETQGRWSNGQGREYTEWYFVDYWRPGFAKWVRYHNRTRHYILKGNVNTYTAVKRQLDGPVIASKIRVRPYSLHPRVCCLRLEIYGCPWTDGIVSYTAPQGQRRSQNGGDLRDLSYDGFLEDGYLFGGLGQLIDGRYGSDSYRLDSDSVDKGYDWVGWRNDSGRYRKPLQLIFEFDGVRNFSSVTIHVSNAFKYGVMIFSEVNIRFSIGGRYYNTNPITYNYMPDTFIENSRNVTIKLKHNIGRYVQMTFTFASRWLLLSEISFQSVPVVGNVSEESGPSSIIPPVREKTEVGGQLMGLVVGVMIIFIILLIIVIFVVVLRYKYRKQTAHTVLHPVEKRLSNGIKELRLNMYVAPKSASVGGTLNGHVVNEITEKDIYSQPHNINPIVSATFKHAGAAAAASGGGGNLQSDINNGGGGFTNLPYADSTTSGDYAEPDMSGMIISSSTTTAPSASPPVPPSLISFVPTSSSSAIHHNISHSPKPSPQHSSKPSISLPSPAFSSSLSCSSDHYYASTDLIKPNGYQGVCGSNVYVVQNVDGSVPQQEQPIVVPEFPRDRLNFIAKLGEGQYGEIHVCEAEVIPENSKEVRIQVFAVKALRPFVPERARMEFWREARALSCLQNDNLVRVLGVCTQQDPPLLLVEYGEHGDLKTYLSTFEDSVSNFGVNDEDQAGISYGTLIYMATQIASGMNHLQLMNFIHRDLAARNCLVGKDYSIKITDFAMCRDIFRSDYYSIDGGCCLVPLRWMAWESVTLGKYSCKSDVWSFAVTLWEILMYGKTRPFEEQSDELVLENMRHYQNNGFYSRLSVFLPQPSNCPKEIYDLMCECWQWREGDRPNFREIHLFLQRKNLGYAPSSHNQDLRV
ncbi:DDR2 (predicted) [Pycnogonum litorale]